ncbi:MAG: MFS transporter [Polyangiaceae bacterium]|jgi:MFS family permease|nr:MFS transporter [Polyangiaceae bacterium]
MTPPRPALPYKLLLPVFLVVLVDVFSWTVALPILPLYAEHLGASALAASALMSAFSACQFVSGPVLGALSDRVGRKPVLVASQVGTFGGLILIATAHSVGQLYVGRIVDGLTAGNMALAHALVAERTPPERRSEAFSFLLAAFGIGFFVGPFVGGYLVRFGIAAPAYAGAALSALSIVASIALLPGGRPTTALAAPSDETPGAAAARAAAPSETPASLGSLFDWRTYGRYLRRPELGPLLWQFGLYAVALSAFSAGVALFAAKTVTWDGRPFGAREVGYLFAYGGLISVVVQGAMVQSLARLLGDHGLARAGFAALALGQLGLGAAQSTPALVAACTLITAGVSALRPSLTSLISSRAGPGEQGAVLGVVQSLESLAGIVSPFVGGLLLNRGADVLWAWYAGAAALVGLALALRSERPKLGAAGAAQ